MILINVGLKFTNHKINEEIRCQEKKPKESVLKQLRQYQEEAKITNNKELEKHKKHEMEL